MLIYECKHDNPMNEDDLGDGMLPVKDHAVGKLQALHDEDYEIQQVLADLVDNSIDAGSTEIDIGFEDCFYPGEQKEYNFLSGEGNYLIIKDNGQGSGSREAPEGPLSGHIAGLRRVGAGALRSGPEGLVLLPSLRDHAFHQAEGWRSADHQVLVLRGGVHWLGHPPASRSNGW